MDRDEFNGLKEAFTRVHGIMVKLQVRESSNKTGPFMLEILRIINF
jgi:hypothetical protein